MADERNLKAIREEIERRAYQRYRDRGSRHGADLDDWLAAEREVAGAKDSTPAGRPRVKPKPGRR